MRVELGSIQSVSVRSGAGSRGLGGLVQNRTPCSRAHGAILAGEKLRRKRTLSIKDCFGPGFRLGIP